MCEECHQFHCPSACPNARDERVGRCAVCGTMIYASEPHLRGEGRDVYHTECLESMSMIELLAYFGIDLREE